MLRLLLVLTPWIALADGLFAQSLREAAPQIFIDELPPHGSAGTLRGRVAGADPSTHEVAPMLHIEGAGWFSKPTRDDRTVPIQSDGSFSLSVYANALDHYSVRYFVGLVTAGTQPPLVEGSPTLPTSPDFLATEIAVRYGRTIHFAGYTWGVKEAPLPVGPGGNLFSAAPESVFVDAEGRLHLTVREVDGQWWSTEVILLDVEGHARYWFTTASCIDALDPNVTTGLFTWDPYGGADPVTANNNREIDFEDARWGDASAAENSQFVVQPWDWPGNIVRYTVPPMPLGMLVTRQVTWTPDRLHFLTLRGAHNPGRAPLADRILDWTYVHEPTTGRFVPTGGRAQWRFNLWPHHPAGPASGADVEVVIADFDVKVED